VEVRPGFKQSEVGVIPEQWDVKPLREVLAKGRLGGNYANGEGETEFPLMKMGNIGRGHFQLTKVQFVSQGTTPSAEHRLARGDILFNTRNTLDLVGKVAIWRDELPTAYYNSNLLRLEFNPEFICSSEYANLFLNTEDAVARLRALATGTTSVAAIYTRDLLGLPIVVPPSSEQRAIAAALCDVTSLLGGLDRLIAKKRDIKQAAMQQLLTGQTRLPEFQGGWASIPFGQVAQPRRERVDPRSSGIEHFCVELEHIASSSGQLIGHTSAGAQSSIKSVFSAGDVLFGKLRAYLRKHWRATRAGVCSTEIWVLAPSRRLITTEFLFQVVKTDNFIEAASNSYGTHMPRSDWSIVKNFELSLPPLPEQAAISAVLSDMDAELQMLELRRDKTCALKQAMMQELLTGRTRLV